MEEGCGSPSAFKEELDVTETNPCQTSQQRKQIFAKLGKVD